MASKAPPAMNPWETHALNYAFPEAGTRNTDGSIVQSNTWRHAPDPIIYPGIYAPSGIDIMNILFRVMARSNPKIQLGPIDCSVSITVCDLHRPDAPIVYVSESFSKLTGYSPQETIGRNCRFLQSPPANARRVSTASSVDKVAVRYMSDALRTGDEVQLCVTNYRKNGQPFVNLLSIVPLAWDADGTRYAVGFQVEAN